MNGIKILLVLTVFLAGSLCGCNWFSKKKTAEIKAAEAPAQLQPVKHPAPAEPARIVAASPATDTSPSKTVTIKPIRKEAVYTATATKRVYSVMKGDTLWSISKRQYGDGQRWQEIVKANPGLDPTKLSVGQKIILP